MTDIKLGQPFGLDRDHVRGINWQLATKRILNDVRSDFIYAPHINFIFGKISEDLIETLKQELISGKFSPGAPLTIEVPKSARIKTIAPLQRLGPTYSRPGSILLPRDRLFYQALADQATPIIAKKNK